MSRSTSTDMFSTFFLVLLCLGPLATMAAYHRVPSGFIQSQALSRLSQCQKKGARYIGECTMSRGKNFADYLYEDSCARLWCVYDNMDGQRMCVNAGLPADNTPCGEYSVCRRGKCGWNNRSG